MSKAQNRLGDAILASLEFAEANGCTFEEMLETLASMVEFVQEWKAEAESLPFLPPRKEEEE